MPEIDLAAEFAAIQQEQEQKEAQEVDLASEFESAKLEVKQTEDAAVKHGPAALFPDVPGGQELSDFASSAGMTVNELANGFALNINKALGIEGSVERLEARKERLAKEHEVVSERSPIASGIGSIGTEVGLSLAPGGLGLKAGGLLGGALVKGGGRIASAVRNILSAGTSGAAAAGALATGKKDTAKGILSEAAIGGAFGAGTGALASSTRGLLSKVLGRTATDKEAQIVRETLEAQGIKPTAGQMLGSERLAKTEEVLKAVPLFGTSKVLKAQDIAAGKAVDKFVTALGAKAGAASDDLITPSQHVLNGLTRQHDKLRKVEDSVYKAVRTQADKAGTSEMPILKDQLQKSIKSLDDIIAPDPADNAMKEQLQAFMQLDGKNFSQLHEFRKSIGNSIDKVMKKMDTGNASHQTYKALLDVKTSITDEMRELASKAGDDVFKRFERVNKFHKERILPFEEINFKKMGSFDRIDGIVDKFVKSNQPERAKELWKSLDVKGKAAFSYGVAQKALDRSMKDGVTDPVKFVRDIDKLGKTLGVAFSGPTRKTFDGIKKAVQIINNQQTKSSTDALLMTGSLIGSAARPTAAVALAPAVAGIKLLLTTDSGVKILQRLSTLKPTSNEAIQIVNRIQEQIRRQKEGEGD